MIIRHERADAKLGSDTDRDQKTGVVDNKSKVLCGKAEISLLNEGSSFSRRQVRDNMGCKQRD